MAKIDNIVIAVDPSKPVEEICAVIMTLVPYHAGGEERILQGVAAAIDKRLKDMKGAEQNA